MPPKKKAAEPEKRTVLGRVKNHLKMGIVGLPNVGKSTFFNLLSEKEVAAENFPFCTIDPTLTRVNVADPRFDWLVEKFKPKSAIAAYLEVTDIAGLVRGAAQGEGLGNAFLSHIHAVDGIFHVVRAFEDSDITHVEESVDPVRDLEIITGELIAKDIAVVEAHITALEPLVARGIDKTKKPELALMKRVLETLKSNKAIRTEPWTGAEIDWINPLGLLTAKPVTYLVNLTPRDYLRRKNKWLVKIKEWVDNRSKETIIPFSAQFETDLKDMGEDERKAHLEENKTQSMIDKIINQGYHSLDLQHFFTCGEKEVKCWTVRKGAKAPQAAGVIHSDFERGFIKAEIYNYEDIKELGSEQAVKEAGKYRTEGKNYLVKDGDIILFKFNVTSAPKKK